jgi:hypothetical protein
MKTVSAGKASKVSGKALPLADDTHIRYNPNTFKRFFIHEDAFQNNSGPRRYIDQHRVAEAHKARFDKGPDRARTSSSFCLGRIGSMLAVYIAAVVGTN